MKKIPFDRYRHSLRDFLQAQGVDVSRSPTNCFAHENHDTPAMILDDHHFRCMSGKCGVKGDIYDAAGIVYDTTNRAEQFQRVQEFFGEVGNRSPAPKKTPFAPDPEAMDALWEWMKSRNDQNQIKGYLAKRGTPEELVGAYMEHMVWWPGREMAEKESRTYIVWRAGVPKANPETGVCSWGPPGAVVRLGTGFKLFYFDESGKSMKVGSKGCRTFPFPRRLPDGDSILVTEGEISALALRAANYPAVAVGGTNALLPGGVKSLCRYENVTIVFDGDDAGKKAGANLAKRLHDAGAKNVLIAELPEAADPDDLMKTGRKKELDRAIKAAKKPCAPIPTANQASPELDIKAAKKAQAHVDMAIKIRAPFRFIGYDETYYYVLKTGENCVLRIGRADNQIKQMLCDIADREWWTTHFGALDNKGKEAPDVHECLAWFRREEARAGWYDERKLLGVGAHKTDDGIWVNTGADLIKQGSGERVAYANYDGPALFVGSRHRLEFGGKAWAAEDGQRFFQRLKAFGFSSDLDYMLVAGWCTLAPFASILDRRPHLAISARKNSGKTTLMDEVLEPSAGEMALAQAGNYTEAAIRQYIGKDCRPVILDEFEGQTKDKNDMVRLRAVLDLARSAYSSNRPMIKGTKDQKGISFRVQSAFCLLGINITLDNDADRSRIPVLKMIKGKGSPRIARETDYPGLRMRTFKNIDRLLANVEAARAMVTERTNDDRLGDTYGTLLGGFWSTISDTPFMRGGKEYYAMTSAAINSISRAQAEDTSDEELILDTILSHVYRLSPDTELTIAEMLTRKDELGNLVYDDELRRLGIRGEYKSKRYKDLYNAEKFLAISVNGEAIKYILRGTPFEEYKQVLGRHSARLGEESVSLKMAGKTAKCLLFDWARVVEIHGIDEKNASLAAEYPANSEEERKVFRSEKQGRAHLLSAAHPVNSRELDSVAAPPGSDPPLAGPSPRTRSDPASFFQ